jgi:photosystem II stability/assembly factor-like uncharacterized protein
MKNILLIFGLFFLITLNISAQLERIYIPEQGHIMNDGWMFNEKQGVSVGSHGVILTTDSAFVTWQRYPLYDTRHLFGIAFFDDEKTGIIVGAKGLLLRTINKGQIWEPVSTNIQDTLYDIIVLNSTDALAIGQAGHIYKSTDKGMTWLSKESGTNRSLRCVSLSKQSSLLAVGASGTILFSGDNGETWQNRSVKRQEYFYTCTWADDNTCFAGGDKLVFLRSENKGIVWDTLPMLYKTLDDAWFDEIFTICFTNDSIGFIAGRLVEYSTSAEGVYKTTNKGKTWFPTYTGPVWKNPQTANSQRSLFQINDTTLYSFSYFPPSLSPSIIVTKNMGETWSRTLLQPNLLIPSLYDIAVKNEKELWITTEQGTLKTFDIQTHTTKEDTIIAPRIINNQKLFTKIREIEYNHGWGLIVADSAQLFLWESENPSWKQIPFLPDTLKRGPAYNLIIIDSTSAFIQYQSYNLRTKESNRYLLLHTKDRGKQWKRITLPPYDYLRLGDIQFIDTRQGYLMAQSFDSVSRILNTPHVFKTENAGETWSEISPPTTLFDPELNYFVYGKIYFLTPSVGYCMAESKFTSNPNDKNGPKLLYTSDGGKSWSMRNDSLGRFSTTISVTELIWLDENRGLFLCNTSVAVIYITSDGGITWKILQKDDNLLESTGYGYSMIKHYDNIYIAGEKSSLYRFNPSGLSSVEAEEPIFLPEDNTSSFIYPNPNNGTFSMRLVPNTAINVIDVLGNIVEQGTTDESGIWHSMSESYGTGYYKVLFTQSDGTKGSASCIVKK